MEQHEHGSIRITGLLAAAFCCLSSILIHAASHGFRIARIAFEDGEALVEFGSAVSNCHGFYECTNLLGAGFASNAQPVALDVGEAKTGILSDVCGSQAFDRISSIPTHAPLDLNRDGSDDVYELRTSYLDPLDAGEAGIVAPPLAGKVQVNVLRSRVYGGMRH